jgi:hypothetical protein
MLDDLQPPAGQLTSSPSGNESLDQSESKELYPAHFKDTQTKFDPLPSQTPKQEEIVEAYLNENELNTLSVVRDKPTGEGKGAASSKFIKETYSVQKPISKDFTRLAASHQLSSHQRQLNSHRNSQQPGT